MTQNRFFQLVKKAVADKSNETSNHAITEDEVYVVWYCKTLQNWKALASTTLMDNMYYEITLNGDKHEMYLDSYHKAESRIISVE
jgi:hypothetical protein